jgi:uncharacterized protein with NAD-binding domain and iron-sulfur cluster
MSAGRKRKIAILGGGVSAMATAWELTREPGWQERYEITLYQLGWRLGGKGASGRGPHGRIEEHGLHIWLGFYQNAFRVLQEAFEELTAPADRPATLPGGEPRIVDGVFASCEDAFERHSYVGVDMELDGTWNPWMFHFPKTDEKPWEGAALPSLWAYIVEMAKWLAREARHNRPVYAREHEHVHRGLLGWLRERAEDLLFVADEAVESVGLALIGSVEALIGRLHPDPGEHDPRQHHILRDLIGRLQGWIAHEFERNTAHDAEGRQHLLLVDMGATVVRGLIADGVLHGARLRDLDEEFRTWLGRHGAMPVTRSLRTNPLLRGLYDFVFAFDEGETRDLDRTANFATGPALRTIFRMCFSYKGSIFWKMRAGMGDTIFTPLYKALERRGVRFRFFHRVERLGLSSDRGAIETVEIARQVTTKTADYDPLVRVVGLDCWPAEPRYADLVEGERLRAAVERQGGLGLESFWFDWEDAESLTLRRGADFDAVVFGISLGSVPFLCRELIEANEAWARMVERVKTVGTMAIQLWMRPDLRGLGWKGDSPVLDAYAEPLNTWADMSHLLPREGWPSGNGPRTIAYFCGALPAGEPDPRNRETPEQAQKVLHEAVRQGLVARIRGLWPGACRADGSLDESLVVDRFERVNVDPSERYVMSVAGSTRFRIKANETGFANLVVTGDWIDNGFNAGCVEASVMAGIQAANAVRGVPDLDAGIIGRELL